MDIDTVLAQLSTLPQGYELRVVRNTDVDYDIALGKRTAVVAVSTISKSPKSVKPEGYDVALKSLRSYSNESVIAWDTSEKHGGKDIRIDGMHARANLARLIATGAWSIPAA